MLDNAILQEVHNLPDKGRAYLIEHLATVPKNTLIGCVINEAHSTEDLDELLNTLQNEAIHNEDRMVKILGPKAVAALLNL